MLTLAKLVASLARHPPISATGRGGLRASPPPSAEPLLKEKPFGEYVLQLLPITAPDLRTQPLPRGTLIADQRRACAARPKGKYSRGRMALAPIRTREFSLPRGAAGGQGHSQLKTSNFYIAHRFFVTFFTEESNVPSFPSFPRPLFPSPLRKKQRRGASSADAANNV